MPPQTSSRASKPTSATNPGTVSDRFELERSNKGKSRSATVSARCRQSLPDFVTTPCHPRVIYAGVYLHEVRTRAGMGISVLTVCSYSFSTSTFYWHIRNASLAFLSGPLCAAFKTLALGSRPLA